MVVLVCVYMCVCRHAHYGYGVLFVCLSINHSDKIQCRTTLLCEVFMFSVLKIKLRLKMK